MLATREVRELVVATGSMASADGNLLVAAARVVANISEIEDGRRLMGREDVCAMLEGYEWGAALAAVG